MPLDGLLEALERDTLARLEAIRADADARIAALGEPPPPPPLPEASDEELSGVRHEARRAVLEARARFLARVHAAAAAALPTEPVDVDEARAFVPGSSLLTADGRVVAEDGSVSVDCTWAGRLQARFAGLARGVLDRLGETS